MFIRNGQTADSLNIPDISELNLNSSQKSSFQRESEASPETSTITGESIKIKKRKSKKRFSSDTAGAKSKISRFSEYLYGRKYYILVLSVIFIAGLVVGAVLVKNLDGKETFDLCSAIDNYFSGIPSINMPARIFSGIALNLVFLLGIYIFGSTVFAPFVCSAFCLYKGLSIGFIIGVYITGGSTMFHLGVCAAHFLLYLLTTVFFILACGESMSFSSFLFRSDDSFKSNLSLKNISVYTSRHLLFLILISMSAIIQTIVMPLIYAFWG